MSTTVTDLQEVDGAEVTVLLDNSLDLLLPSTETAKRTALEIRDTSLIAEHGVSMLVQVVKGSEKASFLFDAGLSRDGLMHNIDVLETKIEEIQAIVLSHGHADHTMGLLGLVRRRGRRNLPLILHPDVFLKRKVVPAAGPEIDLPPPNMADLLAEGIEVVEERESSLLMEGMALVTGEVPRTTRFEKGFPIHYAEVDGQWRPDPLIHDDQAIVINIREKGLVILTGCGHSGIINIVRHAQDITGVDKVYAVMGGFHLTGGLFEPIIPPTVRALKRINPRVVVPWHCTGWKATHRIARSMPESFIPNSVGTRYVL